MAAIYNGAKTFTSTRECLQDAFKSANIGEIKKAQQRHNLTAPVSEQHIMSLTTVVPVSYYHIEDRCNYIVDRFIGVEIHLPSSENHHFRDNRAAHAALSYLLSACNVYHGYQTQQRYEHEKAITMDWSNTMRHVCKLYAIDPEQLASSVTPAYHAIAILKPNYLPIPPEILSFETAHEVSRKRNVILGIN